MRPGIPSRRKSIGGLLSSSELSALLCDFQSLESREEELSSSRRQLSSPYLELFGSIVGVLRTPAMMAVFRRALLNQWPQLG